MLKNKYSDFKKVDEKKKNFYLIKKKTINFFFLNLFIYFLLIISIIVSVFHRSDLIIHPDYNSIIVPVTFFLENSYWNYIDINLISYQPLLQKILVYEIKLIKKLLLINYEDFIPKLIIINNLFFSFFSIILTSKILERFSINNKFISVIPLIYLSIIPFSFSIIELRNENLFIFLTILYIYTIIKFDKNFNIKNIFLISIISASALSTREVAVVYIIVFVLYLFVVCKEFSKYKFIKYSFLYISFTIVFYFLISFRSFELLENYYLNFPIFKFTNYTKDVFFVSMYGSGYLSFFWYLNYFFSTGYGAIISSLAFAGYIILIFDLKFPRYKYILLLFSTIYFLIICLYPVYTDRYTYPLIPFFIFFSVIAINKIYWLIITKKKFNFVFLALIFVINIKSIFWISTFYQKSTRESAVIWINKNIKKNETIFFYNMFDAKNKVYKQLNENYKIIQYFDANEDNLKKIILKYKPKYILSGDNNLSYYYGYLYPFTLENNSKNAMILNNWYKNSESFFIKVSDPKKIFYNSIYQSGLFSKNFSEHSNYMLNFFQPILVFSEIKLDEFN